MNLGTLPVDTFKLGALQVDKIYLGSLVAWQAIHLVEVGPLVYDASTMSNFDVHANTQLVDTDTIVEATAIDTTNIIASSTSNSFNTATPVYDGDVLNVDGSELIASGVVFTNIEEVTNGTFDTDYAGWVASAPEKTSVVNGELVLNNNEATVNVTLVDDNNYNLIDGDEYVLSIDIIQCSTLEYRVSMNDVNLFGDINTVGTLTATFIANTVNNFKFYIYSAHLGSVTLDNISIKIKDAYTVPTATQATTAYIDMNRSIVGTPIDSGGTIYKGLQSSTTGGEPFTADYEFTDISVGSTADVLNTTTHIVDGDKLVIVKDDDSVNEVVASGVTESGGVYSMPYVGMTATSKAYAVGALPSFNFGGNGFIQAVDDGSGSYVYSDPKLTSTRTFHQLIAPVGGTTLQSQTMLKSEGDRMTDLRATILSEGS